MKSSNSLNFFDVFMLAIFIFLFGPRNKDAYGYKDEPPHKLKEGVTYIFWGYDPIHRILSLSKEGSKNVRSYAGILHEKNIKDMDEVIVFRDFDGTMGIVKAVSLFDVVPVYDAIKLICT